MLSHIDSAELDDTLELFGGELPRWSQLLAVTTPRGVKLNKPHGVLVVKHFLLEVGSCQLNHRAGALVQGLSQG